MKNATTKIIQCPRCNSPKVRKKGFEYYVKGKVQKYQCLECFRYWIDDKVINDKVINDKVINDHTKIANVPKKANAARQGSRTT